MIQRRLLCAVDLVGNDLAKRLDAVSAEGEGLAVVDVEDPENAVFRFELVGQIPQEIFVPTEEFGGPFDGVDVRDCGHGSGRHLLHPACG